MSKVWILNPLELKDGDGQQGNSLEDRKKTVKWVEGALLWKKKKRVGWLLLEEGNEM